MKHTYKTKGTCSMQISFDLEGNVVKNVSFYGGCPGNLTAISKAVDGWTVEKITETFRGITCGGKPTSCSDQLAQAVQQAYEKSLEK